MRLAEEKYRYRNYCESTKAFLSYLQKYVQQYDQEQWRWNHYFNEHCDMVCKKYREMADHVYRKFSSKKVLPGQRRFMSLEELFDICKRAELINDKFVEREVNLAYNLSMITQVDELESDRIFQMTLIEFLEAVARISDKYYESNEGLHVKFERMLVHLVRSVGEDEMVERLPQKSIFEGELEEEESSSDLD